MLRGRSFFCIFFRMFPGPIALIVNPTNLYLMRSLVTLVTQDKAISQQVIKHELEGEDIIKARRRQARLLQKARQAVETATQTELTQAKKILTATVLQ